jgi:hypothetical protein
MVIGELYGFGGGPASAERPEPRMVAAGMAAAVMRRSLRRSTIESFVGALGGPLAAVDAQVIAAAMARP